MFRLSATYWGNVWSGPMGTETAVARVGGVTANLLGGERQHVPVWKVPFQRASRRNGRKSEVNHSRNNRSWPLFFWRNTISRMRLTDWQMSVCWKAPGWESERHSFTPLMEGGHGTVTSPRPRLDVGAGPEGHAGNSTGSGVKGTGVHLGSITYYPCDPIRPSVYPPAKQA